jgi:acetoin utilization protein AcuB
MAREITVADVMTREVIWLLEEQNLAQLVETFQRFSFHHLPVLDGKKVVGMVSQRDVLRATIAGVDRTPAALTREARFLERTFVRDLMKTRVVTARPSDGVAVAAARMLESRVDALPVVNEDDELLGIVTSHDLLRLMAGTH